MNSKPNPIIKIVNGPTATQAGLSESTLSGLATGFSSISSAADLMPHDVEGLKDMLQFKIGTAEQTKHRASWFGGRFYNRCSGENPDYIDLSGSHIRQTLLAAKIEPPEIIVNTGKYLLRLDIAKDALSNLKIAQNT